MADGKTVFEYGWSSAQEDPSYKYLAPVLEGTVRAAAKAQGMDKGLRVFDAGCGNGAFSARLLRLGFQVIGCDASEMGIAQAKTNFPDGEFSVASVYDELSTQFGSDYDIVISSEVIEHLYAPRVLVKNALSLLKPGGHFILSTPYHGYLKNLALALSGKMDKHFTVLWDGGHIKFWSQSTLVQLLMEAGFRNLSFKGAGRIPLLWKSMVITCQKPGD